MKLLCTVQMYKNKNKKFKKQLCMEHSTSQLKQNLTDSMTEWFKNQHFFTEILEQIYS